MENVKKGSSRTSRGQLKQVRVHKPEISCQHNDIIHLRHVINLLQPCTQGQGWTVRHIMTTCRTCNYLSQGKNTQTRAHIWTKHTHTQKKEGRWSEGLITRQAPFQEKTRHFAQHKIAQHLISRSHSKFITFIKAFHKKQ